MRRCQRQPTGKPGNGLDPGNGRCRQRHRRADPRAVQRIGTQTAIINLACGHIACDRNHQTVCARPAKQAVCPRSAVQRIRTGPTGEGVVARRPVHHRRLRGAGDGYGIRQCPAVHRQRGRPGIVHRKTVAQGRQVECGGCHRPAQRRRPGIRQRDGPGIHRCGELRQLRRGHRDPAGKAHDIFQAGHRAAGKGNSSGHPDPVQTVNPGPARIGFACRHVAGLRNHDCIVAKTRCQAVCARTAVQRIGGVACGNGIIAAVAVQRHTGGAVIHGDRIRRSAPGHGIGRVAAIQRNGVAARKQGEQCGADRSRPDVDRAGIRQGDPRRPASRNRTGERRKVGRCHGQAAGKPGDVFHRGKGRTRQHRRRHNRRPVERIGADPAGIGLARPQLAHRQDDKAVIPRSAGQVVCPRPAVQRVVARAAGHCIIAARAVQRQTGNPVVDRHRICRRPAIHGKGSRAAVQGDDVSSSRQIEHRCSDRCGPDIHRATVRKGDARGPARPNGTGEGGKIGAGHRQPAGKAGDPFHRCQGNPGEHRRRRHAGPAECIGAQPAVEHVACHDIAQCQHAQRIVAAAARHGILPGAAIQRIGIAATGQLVIPAIADQRHAIAAADNRHDIVSASPVDGIGGQTFVIDGQRVARRRQIDHAAVDILIRHIYRTRIRQGQRSCGGPVGHRIQIGAAQRQPATESGHFLDPRQGGAGQHRRRRNARPVQRIRTDPANIAFA